MYHTPQDRGTDSKRTRYRREKRGVRWNHKSHDHKNIILFELLAVAVEFQNKFYQCTNYQHLEVDGLVPLWEEERQHRGNLGRHRGGKALVPAWLLPVQERGGKHQAQISIDREGRSLARSQRAWKNLIHPPHSYSSQRRRGGQVNAERRGLNLPTIPYSLVNYGKEMYQEGEPSTKEFLLMFEPVNFSLSGIQRTFDTSDLVFGMKWCGADDFWHQRALRMHFPRHH